MRIESSVTSISWIPSEAIRGMTKLPIDMGIGHYDAPPPDVLVDLAALQAADAFRFANELRAWIEVENGGIVDYGHSGGGHIGVTRLGLAGLEFAVPAVAFPDLRPEPEVGRDAVRFVQVAGGRTGVPLPRRVRGAPFIKISSPSAWTTLALTIRADGSSAHEVVGASPFPRHWIYDREGQLVGKTGVIDWKHWFREAHGRHTPWGDEDSPALVTEAETALERQISASVMKGRPSFRKLKEGETLVQQGDPGRDLFLLLDGVLDVDVDGHVVAQAGPGAILGERAVIEGGARTSTLRAATRARLAVFAAEEVAAESLATVARGHQREDVSG